MSLLKSNIKYATKKFAINIISAYQKYISPRKGYSCAYAKQTGEDSCSVYGKKSIQKMGVFSGITLILARFHECKASNEILDAQNMAEKLFSSSTITEGGACPCGGGGGGWDTLINTINQFMQF